MYDKHVRTGVFSLVCAVCLFGGALQAQVQGGGMARSGSGAATVRNAGTRIFHPGEVSVCRHCGRHFRHPRFAPAFPFLYDHFFYPAEYDYDDGYPLAVGAQPPQIIVMHDEEAGSRSTMIGMHNSPGAKVIEVPASVPGEPGTLTSTAARTISGASTVFVFLDGHRLEARRYMVVGESLYITDTRWTSKTIALDQLDLTATLSANRERGIELQMPWGPNEILLSF